MQRGPRPGGTVEAIVSPTDAFNRAAGTELFAYGPWSDRIRGHTRRTQGQPSGAPRMAGSLIACESHILAHDHGGRVNVIAFKTLTFEQQRLSPTSWVRVIYRAHRVGAFCS